MKDVKKGFPEEVIFRLRLKAGSQLVSRVWLREVRAQRYVRHVMVDNGSTYSTARPLHSRRPRSLSGVTYISAVIDSLWHKIMQQGRGE